MSYEPSAINNNNNNNIMRLAYTADGTPTYTRVIPPTSSPLPEPAPAYNNPNGAVAGENSYAGTEVNASGGDVAKRKRGRPRKYPVDGNPTSQGQELTPAGELLLPATATGKKPRGRPRGSGNKQQIAASGSPGAGFMPHVLDVNSGEDVLAKLMWFSQNSTRALCILSASGAVSNVTLQQAATSGGTVTYEGRFEILSLSGSFMVAENDGQRSRTGGLSVALSGPDGRVLGGNVAGLLTAASPVQVIVGSFIPASQKQSKAIGNGNEAEVVNALANHVAGAGGSPSESSGGGLGSPLDPSHNSNPQGMASMPWR